MIHVATEQLAVVQDILAKHVPGIRVRAFGSRVTGERLKQFSDLDLVLMTETPLGFPLRETIREAFSESDLPMSVDILEWCDLSPTFQAIIEQDHVVIQ